eukprot:341289_1
MTAIKLISILIGITATIIGVVLYNTTLSTLVIENVLFSQFSRGILCVYFPNGKMKQYGSNSYIPMHDNYCDVSMQINDKSFFSDLLINAGTTGLGETYMKQKWDSNNMHKIMHYFTDNVVHLKTPYLLKLLKSISPNEWIHWFKSFYLNKNKKHDQQYANVGYSIGNKLFEHMLDERTMTYTCAIFPNGTADLVSAQFNKYQILLNKLDVNNNSFNILEIGSGWGGIGSFIQNKTGTNYTAINIAQPQIDYSNNRWAKGNDKLRYIHLDYRDSVKYFGVNSMDRIISVGCLEHAGHPEQLFQFFNATYNVLKPGGRMVLHFISRNNAFREWIDFNQIHDSQYVTFVDKYIFPGSYLNLPDNVHNVADKVGFKLIHKEFYGQHYLKTLVYWRQKFERPKSKKFIIDTYGVEFYRSYVYGLALSEAGFRVGVTDLIHMIFIKPNVQNQYRTDIHYQHDIFI